MGYVKYETKGAVAVVTIDREKALNALNAEVLDDLKATFEGIDTETVRCVIVTGAGEKSFVAGADIAAMSGMDAQGGEAFGKKGNDIFRMIETFPLPVIAAVNGFALGGGCELAMSCDFRICAEQAIFGQPEVGSVSHRASAVPSVLRASWDRAWRSSSSTPQRTSRRRRHFASAS